MITSYYLSFSRLSRLSSITTTTTTTTTALFFSFAQHSYRNKRQYDNQSLRFSHTFPKSTIDDVSCGRFKIILKDFSEF